MIRFVSEILLINNFISPMTHIERFIILPFNFKVLRKNSSFSSINAIHFKSLNV